MFSWSFQMDKFKQYEEFIQSYLKKVYMETL